MTHSILNSIKKGALVVIAGSLVTGSIMANHEAKLAGHLKSAHGLVQKLTTKMEAFFDNSNKETMAAYIQALEVIKAEITILVNMLNHEKNNSEAHKAASSFADDILMLLNKLQETIKSNQKSTALAFGKKLQNTISDAQINALKGKLCALKKLLKPGSPCMKEFENIERLVTTFGAKMAAMGTFTKLSRLAHRLNCK